MRILFLLLLAIPAWGQFGAATQVVNGNGAPNVAYCTSANIFASPITDTTAILKMDWSTTNVVTSRWTGTTWRQIDSTAKSSLFTTAPNQIAFTLGSQATANVMTILSLELL